MTDTLDVQGSGLEVHPYDYYYRPGMDLRPAPARVASSPDWFELRKRVLGAWRDVAPQPAMTPLTERLADHFWQGDEFIDPVVKLALATNVGDVRKIIDQALDEGIDAVQHPPREIADLFAHLDRKPDWFDADMYEKGRVALANQTVFGGLGGMLVNVVMTAQGTGVSSATGATGRFVRDFYRRAVETNEFFRAVSRPGSSDRFSDGFKTNVRVRFMHGLVRANLSKRWGPDSYRTHGNPISAADMALGVPAYSTINLLIDNRLGYNHTVADIDAVAMFWSYTAYVFGVPESLIPRNGDEANEMFDFILSTYGRESSRWATELSSTFSKSLVKSYVRQDSVVGRFIGSRLVLPAVAGYFHYVCGSPVSDRVLAQLGYTHRQLKRYSRIAGVGASVAVRTMRLVDSRPGRAARRHNRATKGTPFSNLQAKVSKSQAKAAGISTLDFQGHDSSTAADFADR
ncbi:oxygenase MpaB family protein [Rhodococcus sp. 24CO]|uniref:oxygenase MpaB family protein n=1 Tax=Rhodococcus sp. 24CO TaxID=3117460 RepID=UPI003D335B20